LPPLPLPRHFPRPAGQDDRPGMHRARKAGKAKRVLQSNKHRWFSGQAFCFPLCLSHMNPRLDALHPFTQPTNSNDELLKRYAQRASKKEKAAWCKVSTSDEPELCETGRLLSLLLPHRSEVFMIRESGNTHIHGRALLVMTSLLVGSSPF
jgi:hypothetical protein